MNDPVLAKIRQVFQLNGAQVANLSKTVIRNPTAVQVLCACLHETGFQKVHLKLDRCGLTADSMAQLCASLQVTLQTLSLSGNELGDAGAANLSLALERLSNLTEIDLRYNNITAHGLASIARGIQASNVKVLDLSNNALGNSRQELKDFISAVNSADGLLTLRIGYNKFTAISAQAIANELSTVGSITELDLRLNNLGPDGCRFISTGIKTQPIKTLILAGNNIQHQGAEHIMRAVAETNCTTELDLSNNNLGVLGAAHVYTYLRASTSLRQLNLSSNQFGDGVSSIVCFIRENTSVEMLNLASNKFSPEAASELVAAVGDNATLRSLDLAKTRISAEHAEIIRRKLASNSVRPPQPSMPEAPETTAGSTEFDPFDDIISPEQSPTIRKIRAAFESLNDCVNLSRLPLGSEAYALTEIRKLLRSTRDKSQLRLDATGLDDGNIICSIIQEMKHIHTLSLSQNNFRDEGLRVFIGTMREARALTSIDLRYNSLGVEALKLLLNAKMEGALFQKLDLSNNDFSDDDAGPILSQLLRSLSCLRLGYARLGLMQIGQISSGLVDNFSITELDLRLNALAVDGAIILGEGLRSARTLRKLNLSGNNIGPQGTLEITSALAEADAITSLDLSNNNFGEEGARALADKFGRSANLAALNVCNNHMRDSGAEAMGQLIGTVFTLTSLNLAGNEIGEDGGRAISSALSVSSTLVTLDLSNNFVSASTAAAIQQKLIQNSLDMVEEDLRLHTGNPALGSMQWG